jgi:hypothetical protein
LKSKKEYLRSESEDILRKMQKDSLESILNDAKLLCKLIEDYQNVSSKTKEFLINFFTHESYNSCADIWKSKEISYEEFESAINGDLRFFYNENNSWMIPQKSYNALMCIFEGKRHLQGIFIKPKPRDIYEESWEDTEKIIELSMRPKSLIDFDDIDGFLNFPVIQPQRASQSQKPRITLQIPKQSNDQMISNLKLSIFTDFENIRKSLEEVIENPRINKNQVFKDPSFNFQDWFKSLLTYDDEQIIELFPLLFKFTLNIQQVKKILDENERVDLKRSFNAYYSKVFTKKN